METIFGTKQMGTFWARFAADQQGSTAIEYGLIAAGIAVAISAVVFTFGDELETLFTGLTTTMEGANAP